MPHLRVRHLDVNRFAGPHRLSQDALPAVLFEFCGKFRADLRQIVQERLVAGQLDHCLVPDEIRPRVPNLRHKQVRPEEGRRSGGRPHSPVCRIALGLLENHLVGKLDRLAKEEDKIRLAHTLDRLEVVEEALGDSDAAELAGHLPARFASHAVGDEEERPHGAQTVVAQGGSQSDFAGREVADYKVVFVVLADLSNVGHPKNIDVDSPDSRSGRSAHDAHRPLPPVSIPANHARSKSSPPASWRECGLRMTPVERDVASRAGPPVDIQKQEEAQDAQLGAAMRLFLTIHRRSYQAALTFGHNTARKRAAGRSGSRAGKGKAGPLTPKSPGAH